MIDLQPSTSHDQPADASRVIQRSSRSFSLASRFLPSSIRSKVTALYAWCRSVDDAVDLAEDTQQASQELQRFEDDLLRAQAGESISHPGSQYIYSLVSERQIEVRHAKELIHGMRLDLEGFVVESPQDLEYYCYHAAGTVGLMMTRLMGVKDRSADKHAVALGIAMQLTNIARDVREDAERGRSYLPGITKVLEAEPNRIERSVAEILRRAENHYDFALKGLHYLPWQGRISIRVASEVYREIGRQIQRNDHSVLFGRTVLTKRRLAWVTARSLLASIFVEILASSHKIAKYLSSPLSESVMNESTDNSKTNAFCSPIQAKQVVFLGLSLTCIMATALFVLVYVNPKDSNYSYLPLVYSGLCLIASIVFHRLSGRPTTWTVDRP